MLEAATPRGVRYITYGSHRRIAGNSPPSREARPASCLVLPDAEPREHALLFQFAVNCARALPDITFTFRPHPAAGAMLRRRQQIDAADLPANLRVDAQTPLLQQAGAVRCCLYRASSAVFHAVLAGARPLYVSASQEMPFDPLAAMTRGRTSVRTPADIAAAVRESDWSGSEDARIAWNYCDRYVAPVRPSALDELLLLASANG